MKKFTALLLMLFAVSFVRSQHDLSQGIERIIHFHADITVDVNASVEVTEKIKVHAKGYRINHGIFRALPKWRDLNNKQQFVNYKILSVKKNGAKEKYHTKSEGGFLMIYMGDGNITLSPGDYEYELTYTADNQIGFFNDYDELYWNINGTQWEFSTENVSATVVLPEHSKILQHSCFSGGYGSSSRDCVFNILSENTIEWQAKDLNPGEGLTIAVGFGKDVIAPPPPPGFLEKYGLIIGGLLSLFWLLDYYFKSWRNFGVDPPTPTVYPQFSPPDNLSPASIGYIQKGYFGNEMLTAALVNLAVNAYIKITESEEGGFLGFGKSKKFVIQGLKDAEDENAISAEEKILLDSILSNPGQRIIVAGKYDPGIESMVKSFKQNLSNQHNQFLNEGNNRKKLWLPFIVITLVYFVSLFVSWKFYPVTELLVIGVFLYGGSLFLFILITFLFGMLRFNLTIFLFFITFIFILAMVLVTRKFNIEIHINFLFCYFYIIITFLSMILFQYLIKRPSEEKLRKKSMIDGLKMYMSAAENKQLQYFNPPEMTPQFFEKLLPFAMVLGVDKIWGEKFENYINNSTVEYQNSWYFGNSINSMGISSMGRSLASGLTSSIQAASTQPSSSGSGSGGGGFSGGGGGGGGGGGW
ncbi:MAG: DUF2207 domain-containing protein [Weeksellaceae bacterium]